jgi:hypothetical protein
VTRTRGSRLGQFLAAGLAAVLGSAGCGSTPAEPADPRATGTPPTVQFTAGVEVRGQSLQISYQLVNSSGQDLIVLNQVPAFTASGSPKPDVNAVYVTGADLQGRVEISKRAFAMPDTENKSWAQAARISGVVVKPGQSVGEELTVPLPLRRHHPYGDDLGEGTISLPDPVTEVVFCLGVIREAEARLPSGGAETPVTLPHLGSTTGIQHLSCSAPVRL